jgi:hypothetical protein
VEEVNIKTCTKCGLSKPLSQYSSDCTHKDGLKNHCKSCNKAYYATVASHISQVNKSKEFSIEGSFKLLRKHAIERHLEFTIKLEDYINRPLVCAIFNTPLKTGREHINDDNYLTFDRVDNDVGYVSGNVEFVCRAANRLKNKMNLTQIRQIAAYMEKHLDKSKT